MPASPRASSSSAGSRSTLQLTENSRSQRDGLAGGKFDVVHSAVDNALAMIEVAKHDVVIVTGGDSGMNEFFVQAEIKSFADMRGRTLVVDAPDTAYALQAKKILRSTVSRTGADYTVKPVGAGVYRFKAMVESKDNAAAILNLPFTVQAEQLGMKSLGRTVDLLGPYQAGGAFVMRAGRATTRRCSSATSRPTSSRCAGRRDPANRAESIALLVEKLKISAQGGGAHLRPPHRPRLRLHARRQVRPRGLQQRAGAARRDRRWQAGRAGTLYRPRLLRARDEAGRAVTSTDSGAPAGPRRRRRAALPARSGAVLTQCSAVPLADRPCPNLNSTERFGQASGLTRILGRQGE